MKAHFRWTAVLLLLAAGAYPHGAAMATELHEPYDSDWTFYLDNDLFALLNRDQQYTGGAAVELAGRRATEYPWSLDPLLGFADRVSGFDRLSRSRPDTRRHSFSLGVAAFTPKDIRTSKPVTDDHPYASIVAMGNTRQSICCDAMVRYRSSLTLGLLGTNVAQQIQNFFHDLNDSARARGWDNQISDGGEPTLQYAVSRQRILRSGQAAVAGQYDWNYDTFGSIGYITEVGIGTGLRWGRLRSRWWSFDPVYGNYIHMDSPLLTTERRREWFFWIGVNARIRLYNALLEGQFRDSEVTVSRGELRTLLGAAGAGVTADISDTGLRASFEVHIRSDEIPNSHGDTPIWGRIMITHSF